MNLRFAKLQARKDQLGHKNKCVVIAIALLTDLSYDVVYAELQNNMDRRITKRGGFYKHEYLPVLRSLLLRQGKELDEMELYDVRKHAKTVRTLDNGGAFKLGIKFGLVHTRGHCLAVVNYQVQDWSEETVKRITAVRVIT